MPISAIFFGGRRRTTIPLVTESRDWQHGVFLGATLSSETTAAATGAVGVVRRDPMAMLPFIGYNAGDYFGHWIAMGKHADASKLPRIFYVNWFRRDADGGFLWPGFGENIRVLKWAVERIEGTAAAVETPVGYVPAAGSLDVTGLDMDPADLERPRRSTSRSGGTSCRRSSSGSPRSATSCRPACATSSTRCASASADPYRRKGPTPLGDRALLVRLSTRTAACPAPLAKTGVATCGPGPRGR